MPLGLKVMERAFGTFSAYNWILNPGGSVIFLRSWVVFSLALACDGIIKMNTNVTNKTDLRKGFDFISLIKVNSFRALDYFIFSHQNIEYIRFGQYLSKCVDCTFKSTKKLNRYILGLLNKFTISADYRLHNWKSILFLDCILRA
jgi:hypothetical protein